MTQPAGQNDPPAARDQRADVAQIAVFVSGGGRTLRNLAEQIDRGTLDARIVLVVASRPCPGEAYARERGVPTRVQRDWNSAHEFEQLLEQHNVQWVVLAGYLSRVPTPPAWTGRIVNIHPALLPKHGGPGMFGLHVHRAVLDAGDVESGCTVHLVTQRYDEGPILAQARCPVEPGDTPDSLAARVFALETELYPATLASLFAQNPGSAASAASALKGGAE